MRKFNRKVALKDYFRSCSEGWEKKNTYIAICSFPIWVWFIPALLLEEIFYLTNIMVNGKAYYQYGGGTVDHYLRGMDYEKQKFLESISNYNKEK